MQAACRIDEEDIHVARLGGLQGVKDDGGWIGPFLVGDDIAAGPFAPDLQLGRSGGTERIAGSQHDLVVEESEIVGQLADGRGLADAVDADHQDDRRMAADAGAYAVVVEQVRNPFLQERDDILRALDLLLFGGLAHIVDQFFRRGDAYIGRQQDHFQFIQKVLVNLGGGPDQFTDAVREILPRLGEALF